MKNKRLYIIFILSLILSTLYLQLKKRNATPNIDKSATQVTIEKKVQPKFIRQQMKEYIPQLTESSFGYPKSCTETWKSFLANDIDTVISQIEEKKIAFQTECEAWEKNYFGDAYPNCSNGEKELCYSLVPRYRSNIVDAIYDESIPATELPEEVLWHKMIARAFRPKDFSKDVDYILKIANRAHELNPRASWPLQVKHMYLDHIHADIKLFIELADEFRKVEDKNPAIDELQLERHIYTYSQDKIRYIPVLKKHIDIQADESMQLAILSELAWVEGRKSDAIAFMKDSIAMRESEDKVYALKAMITDKKVEPFTVRLNYQVYWMTDPLEK